MRLLLLLAPLLALLRLLTMRLVSVGLVAGLLLVGAARRRSQGPSSAPRTRTRTRPRLADLGVLAVVGAFDVGANGAFAVASQSDLISVTAVLASLYPVVTVLLARQMHGERLVGLQLPGVGLALLGVVLLAGG